MALAVDSEMPSNAGSVQTAGVSSMSFSFTNTAGTFLQILASGSLGGASDTITSMKYNSVEADAKQLNRSATSGTAYQGIGTKSSPATGANTVSITFSANISQFNAGCISYTGQHATTPVGNTATSDGNSGGHHTQNLSSSTGNIVVGLYGDGCGIASSDGTKSWSVTNTCSFTNGSGWCDRFSGGTTVTTGFTDIGADLWMITAQEVVVAASGITTEYVAPVYAESVSAMIGRRYV